MYATRLPPNCSKTRKSRIIPSGIFFCIPPNCSNTRKSRIIPSLKIFAYTRVCARVPDRSAPPMGYGALPHTQKFY